MHSVTGCPCLCCVTQHEQAAVVLLMQHGLELKNAAQGAEKTA